MLDEEVARIAMAEWAQALHGLTGEEIGRAIEYCRQTLEWAPTIAEFLRYAKEMKPSGGDEWVKFEFITASTDESREAAREARKKIRKLCGLTDYE